MKEHFKRFNLPCDLGAGRPGNVSPLFDCRVLWKVEEDESYNVTGHLKNGFTHHGLFFTYKGSGRMELPGRPVIDLEPFSLFTIRRGTPCHYWCPKNGMWHFYCLQFMKPDALKPWTMDFNTHYESMSAGRFTGLFESISREAQEQAPAFGLKIDGLVNEFLVSYARELAAKDQKGPMEEARAWMHRNLGNPLDMEGLIKQSGLCRTAFFKAFLHLTGKTPVNYFNDLKLEAARMMVKARQASVRAIAQSLAFYDEYYFSRMFKRKYGASPLLYRKQADGKRKRR
jgi:AraC-like DNA-binding protein